MSKLERAFRKRAAIRGRVLAERYGEALAANLDREALAYYLGFLAEIDRIPGGVMNGALAGTYEYLAYGLAMRDRDISDEKIGAFFHESWQAMVDRFPKRLGGLLFRLVSPLLRRRIRKEAAATRGAAEGEWQFDYVESADGRGFGFDVKSCAVCGLFERHDAGTLVPYLCSIDDKMSQALDMGLRRNGTRALGNSCCDFRYHAGSEPKPLEDSRSLPIVLS